MPYNKVTIETQIAELEYQILQLSGEANIARLEERDNTESVTKLHVVQEKVMELKDKRERMVADSLKFLYSCAKLVANEKLNSICTTILDDKRFQRCTASKKQHQSYDGGLVVHTAEVLDIALSICRSRSITCDHDVLITAAIFHDYAKIWDYTQDPPVKDVREKQEKYAYTPHQEMIRHLPRSYAVFMEMVGHNEAEVTEELKMKIGHCILAHHGRKEWGSPVDPQIPEAYAIHFADMMSANCTKDYY